MNKRELGNQAILAMEFLEKMYFEISYLIKEMEGLLKREKEHFEIGRPKGYGISAPGSVGIEFPDWWWYKKFSVFFVPGEMTKKQGGKTHTGLSGNIRVLYLLFNLYDKEISTPKIAFGVISGMENTETNYFNKFEEIMIHSIIPVWENAQKNPNFKSFHSKHKNFNFNGKFKVIDLFDIKNTEDIQSLLIDPVLGEFRKS